MTRRTFDPGKLSDAELADELRDLRIAGHTSEDRTYSHALNVIRETAERLESMDHGSGRLCCGGCGEPMQFIGGAARCPNCTGGDHGER